MDNEASAGTAPGTKVLVIDDSNTIRRSAELFLRQAGYEVILAEDGFDALAKISDHQPQVIFVDIMMPRLDGYQTCALIKQHPAAGGAEELLRARAAARSSARRRAPPLDSCRPA